MNGKLLQGTLTGSGMLLKFGIALVLFTVYVKTLLPGVGYSPDTAKFQFVGYVLGTTHAPGYPTYIILNHLFTTSFPVGSIAYRANLLSAIFSVATALVLFEILKLFKIRDSVASAVSLVFGFTPTFWSQSIVAEVYTLNALFLASTIYFLLRWTISRKDGDLIKASAVYAFSFGNHLIISTFLPAVFFLVWSTDKSVFLNKKIVLFVSIFIILGALQYLYPVWRYYNPSTVFLEMQTPNIGKLVHAVSGGQFKSRMFAFDARTVLLDRIPMFLRFLWREYSFLMFISILGMFRIKNAKVNAFFVLGIIGNLFYSLNYNIKDIFVYFIPTYLILAIYLGIGLQALCEILFRDRNYISIPLLLVVPVLMFAAHYSHVDQSKDVEAGEKAKSILERVGKDAVILTPGREFPRHYFSYYLLGENMQRNNLYVLRFSPKVIEKYLVRGKPYYFRVLRKEIPSGLRVFCIKEGQELALQKRFGLKLEKVDSDLYHVVKAE
jgi:hypothetical protein